MTGYLMLSDEEVAMTEELRPHYSIHDISRPGKLNGNMKMPDATVGTISNAIEQEDYRIAGLIQ